MPENPREHGKLQIPDDCIDGPPRILGSVDGDCPYCGCKGLYSVEVKVVNLPLLRSNEGVGTYIGCAACPWASPMSIVDKKAPSLN